LSRFTPANLQAGRQSVLELGQMFRAGIINSAHRVEGTPIPIAMAETSQVAIRIALLELLTAENVGKSQSRVIRA
jgi:hypothetical protein